MARKLEMSTVTAKHFTAFTEDLLSDTLEALGIDWQPKRTLNYRSVKRWPPVDFENLLSRVSPEFEDEVLRLRSQLDSKFSKQVSDSGGEILKTTSNLMNFIHSSCELCFKDPDFRHAFYVFSAFILDLALRCFQRGKGDLVKVIISSMDHVYETHLKEEFKKFTYTDIFG